ncbi:MAG TPA: TetR/AcrR family transcriptional regulator [Thermomicrobiales bacterium]|nr:TetR/AcrR family transcriptional regulator [Thermomicrobiales bacterium]
MSETAVPANWQTSKRVKTFRKIQDEAIRLFLEKGFDATTIDEIAETAGVSHMTVFRHFPTKESLVLTDEFDALMEPAIRRRPPEEGPVEALVNVIRDLMASMADADFDRALARAKLMASTPSLRGGVWANWTMAKEVVTKALLDRANGEADIFQIRVLTAVLIVIAMTASEAWAEQDGQVNLVTLIDRGLATLADEAEILKSLSASAVRVWGQGVYEKSLAHHSEAGQPVCDPERSPMPTR